MGLSPPREGAPRPTAVLSSRYKHRGTQLFLDPVHSLCAKLLSPTSQHLRFYRSRQSSTSLIIVAYVLCGVVLVFVMRFARPWLQCKGPLGYQHVDLSVLKLIVKDPMMLVIVAACVLFMVIDFIIPRTAMSFGDSSMLVVELLTILFSDAQVNESRHLSCFTLSPAA